MTKYQFTDDERYAVFVTHAEKCYICKKPIDLASFQVDHVIPESLAKYPEPWSDALHKLGLPRTFDVNSYENWLPSCAVCNRDKADSVWEPSLLAQRSLQNAAKKADAARAAEQHVVTSQRLGRAINTLRRAQASGVLSDEIRQQLQPIILDIVASRPLAARLDVVRLTPDYAVPLVEVLSDNGLTRVVRGPFGIGGGPSRESRVTCPICGYGFFNGARCVVCGQQDDGD